tara:strand:+ start:229 stop:450 length:222 start_codon:yes stop_codon:yes gene_type:complete
VSQEGFDPTDQVSTMLRRCRATRLQWSQVYSTIGVPFQYRSPSADEYMLAINIVTRAARVAKEENKNDDNSKT